MDLFRAVLHVEGGQVDTGRQDRGDRHVAELKRGRHQFSLFFVDGSFFLHVLNDVVKLVFRDGGFLVALKALCDTISDERQEFRKRPQNGHEEAEKSGKGQTGCFRGLLSDGLREKLRQEEHCDRDRKCADRHRCRQKRRAVIGARHKKRHDGCGA